MERKRKNEGKWERKRERVGDRNGREIRKMRYEEKEGK
jgi:hypothetical protein